MINTILNSLNVLGIFTNITNCDSVLGDKLTSVLKEVYMAMQIAVPILVILLCSVDILKAVTAQNEKDMSAAGIRSVKRIIIGFAIFFIPILIDAILDLAGLASGTCHIGG